MTCATRVVKDQVESDNSVRNVSRMLETNHCLLRMAMKELIPAAAIAKDRPINHLLDG